MEPLWRSTEPRRRYDVIVVGAGGHGLATAHALASRHGVRDVAVLEQDWLGSGNIGRNAAIIRANFLRDEDVALHREAMALWTTLGDELGHEIYFDRSGLLSLAHDDEDLAEGWRLVNVAHRAGLSARFVRPDEVSQIAPLVRPDPRGSLPIAGGFHFEQAGSAKHDQVAWAYAAAAHRLGVDVVEGCRVTGFQTTDGIARGVHTNLGPIEAGTVVLAASSGSPELLALLGIDLPLQLRPLQAYVTELLEDLATPVVMSRRAQLFLSQADKGELVMGLPLDPRPARHRRAGLRLIEAQAPLALALVPSLRFARVLRIWAGLLDLTPDGRPFIGFHQPSGVLVNCGWGTGGFKATPAVGRLLAEAVVSGVVPPLLHGYAMDRITDEDRSFGRGLVAH